MGKSKRVFTFFILSCFFVSSAYAIKAHKNYEYSDDKEGVVRDRYDFYDRSEFPLKVCIDTNLIPDGSMIHDQVILAMRLWNVVNEQRQKYLHRENLINESEYQHHLPPFALFRFYNQDGCGSVFGRFHIKVKTKYMYTDCSKYLGEAHTTGRKRTVWIDRGILNGGGFVGVLWENIV